MLCIFVILAHNFFSLNSFETSFNTLALRFRALTDRSMREIFWGKDNLVEKKSYTCVILYHAKGFYYYITTYFFCIILARHHCHSLKDVFRLAKCIFV